MQPHDTEKNFALIEGLSVGEQTIVGDTVRMEGDVEDSSGTFLSLPFNGECALEPYMCESGLAVGLFVRITDDDLQQSGPKYIITAGYGNATGFSIYRNSTNIVIQVRDGNYLWTSTVNETLDSSGFLHIGFVWNEEDGLTALIDGEAPSHQVITKVPYNVMPNLLGNVTLGARIDENGMYTDFASGTYDELRILEEYIPDDENRAMTFMGGVDGDDCRGVSCNHGLCKDTGVQSFECLCDTGYSGEYCDENNDECFENPCLNGATCHDRIGMFYCECVFGYDGETCEIDLIPTYNYSLISVVVPEDLLDENDQLLRNPAYVIAQLFESMVNDESGDSISVDAVGRGDEGTYARMTAERSWMNAVPGGDMSFEGGECFAEPSRCDHGFAVSFWMFVDSSIVVESSAVILNAGANKGYGEFTILELTETFALKLSVGHDSATEEGQTEDGVVELGNWVNMGLTWSIQYGLALYINGRSMELANRNSAAPGSSNSPRITFGTVYYPHMKTAYPVAISDFVIWNRYLYPFETHRFFGATASEGSYLKDAAYYWTSDGFLVRDLAALTQYKSNLANSSEISLPGGAVIQVSEGRDSKGEASHVDGNNDLWFLLADLPGTCISDPFLCQEGVTLAIWARVYPVDDDQVHFIVSTGEQSTRGLTIYMRQGVLGASVNDGDKRWITEIDFTPDPAVWIHLGVSWRKETGMAFYKDSILVSFDPVGIRKIREADLDFKIFLGCRNDFLGDYSAMEFEELIFWEKYVENWEAREVFGFPAMEQYDDALYSWNSKELITSKLDLLMTHVLNEGDYIGPSPTVRVTEEPMAVDLTEDVAALILGSYSSDCFTSPDDCDEGLSVSLWLKMLHGSASDPEGYILSAGRGDGNGVAVYKNGHFLVFLVESQPHTWVTKVPVQAIPSDEWCNIAFTWSKVYDITVYIDGRKQIYDNATDIHVPEQSTANDYLTVGRPNDAESNYANFLIYNLAIWDKYTFERKANKLSTLTDSQVSCIHENKICWPFESFLSFKYPYELSTTGAILKPDRFYDGRSVYTDGKTGSVSLGNFKNKCPKRPSACENGFSLTMWLKLEDNVWNTGAIVSLGAEVQNEQGIALVKDELGLLATVSDGNKIWISRIYNGNFTYGPWMYLAMTWSEETGVFVYIDGEDLTHPIENGTESVRSGRNHNELYLGHSPHLENDYIRATFDDVVLEFPVVNEVLPDADALTGLEAVTAYASADEYYDLATSEEVTLVDSEVVTDRNNDRSSAVNTGITNTSASFGFIDVGRYRSTCISDPTKCTASGVTISTWIKFNSIDHFSNNITNPDGLGYILSSGAQDHNGRGFSVTYDGHNMTATMQHSTYKTRFSVPFQANDEWFNFALSWSETQGLRIYIDGIMIGSSSKPIETPLVSDLYTSLHLGKRNDKHQDYLGASFDDFATFYKTFEEDDPSLSTLQGVEEETGVVVIDNHEELDSYAPFSGKPDCKVLHDADCARTIYELNDILNDESIINGSVLISATQRLEDLVEPNNDLPAEDIGFAIQVVNAIVHAPVYDELNETEAESDLLNIVEITSNMMQPNRSSTWNEVNEVSFGTPRLVVALEFYGKQISRRLRKKTGHEKMVIPSNNIVMQIDSFESSSHYEKYEMPDYNHSNWKSPKDRWTNTVERIILPKNMAKFTEPGETLSVVYTIYDTLPDMIPQVGTKDVPELDGRPVTIISRVLSLTCAPGLRMDLYNPIELIFPHTLEFKKNSTHEVACAFWNYTAPNETNGAWDTRGCVLVSTSKTATTCNCYHMTSFSIIIKPIIDEEEESDEDNLAWIARIFSIFSISFLGVFLFYLIFARRLWVILHTIHINLCVAVIFALISLSVSGIIKDAWGDCMMSGCLIHYFNTVVMCWIFIEAFQLFSDLSESLEIKDDDDDEDEPPFQERVKYYVLFGWGAPFLNVGVAFCFSPDAYIEQEAGFCWLDESDFLWCAFVGPLILMGLTTLYILYRMLRDIDEQVYREDRTTIFKSSYFGTWVLQIYFMASWCLGLVGIYGIYLFALYIFILTISCFGIIVFVVHAVLNTEVRYILGLRDPDKKLTPIEKIHLPPEFDDIQYIKPTYIP